METLIITPASRSKMEALKAFLTALKIDFKTVNGNEVHALPEGNAVSEADKPYNPEFVAKIKASREEIKQGKGVKIKLEDLWK
jgi:hypothetical protein